MASSKYREVAGIQFEAIYETWPDAIMAKTVSFSCFSLLDLMLCILISGGGRPDKIGWKIKSETGSISNSAEVESFPFVQINSLSVVLVAIFILTNGWREQLLVQMNQL